MKTAIVILSAAVVILSALCLYQHRTIRQWLGKELSITFIE